MASASSRRHEVRIHTDGPMRKRLVFFAAALSTALNACGGVSRVEAGGKIQDHPTLGLLDNERGRLDLCVELEVLDPNGETRTEQACARPTLGDGSYSWSAEVGAGIRLRDDVRVSGARLTYEHVENHRSCSVRETATEKSVHCTADVTRLTYGAAAETETAPSRRLGEVRIPLDWDLSRAPDEVQKAVESVELAGHGVVDPGAQCLPELAPAGAWLAADGGRSIPLADGRSLHLFGDTLLGPADADDARENTFVGNSVGISRCDDEGWHVDYHYRDDGRTRSAIFDLDDGSTRLWPVDGFRRDGRLHVVLAKIIHIDSGLGFDYAGSVLATVSNPNAAPTTWQITYQDLTGRAGPRPGKGVTVHDGDVYLYSSIGDGAYPHPAGLLRLPTRALGDVRGRLEYLSNDGGWKPLAGAIAGDVRVVVEETSPNMYVHFHDKLGKWVTVHADPTFGSPDMILRTADDLAGPWSKGKLAYKFPEMLDDKNRGRDVICYAVTEHPQLRRDGEQVLVVTYACNTLAGPLPSPDDLEIYRPKTVTLNLDAL